MSSPQPTAALSTPAARGRRRPVLTFVAAVAALIAAFVAVGSTIPLFNVYRAEEGFSNADIAVTVVAYSAATLATLLIAGRVSGHVGRRPVALVSLALLALGCVLLLQVHDVASLVVGRLVMGVGAGLASSSLTSYIVDAAPSRPAWLASVASSQTVMLGLAIGAIASGALVQFAPWPRELIYLVVIALLLVSASLLAASDETVRRRPGAWHSLRPRVHVPVRVRRLLPVTGAVLLATWATGSFFQAFVPALVASQLHTRSPLVIGIVFAGYMGFSAVGSPLSGRFSPAAGQRGGMTAFLVAWIGLTVAIATGALWLFLAATVLAGAAQGVAISAATRGILVGSTVAERASIFAVVYLLSYTGATVPSLISGELSLILTLPQIAIGYAVLALLMTAFTLVAAREPQEERARRNRP